MQTEPFDEKYPIVTIDKIVYDIEDTGSQVNSVFSINIANLKHYYDAYGPEQRNNALKLVYDVLSFIKSEGQLLYHARYDLDKFIATTSLENSVDNLTHRIRKDILGKDVEIFDSKQQKEGIDIRKIEVYIGAAHAQLPIRKLVDLAIEAEQHAKNSPAKIYIIKK